FRREGLAYFVRALPFGFGEAIERGRQRRTGVLAKRRGVASKSVRRRAGVLMLTEQVLQRFGLERRFFERLVRDGEEFELVAQTLRTDAQPMQVFRVRL